MIVFITGASGAIGQQLARLAAQEGAALFLMGNRHYERLNALAQELSDTYDVRVVTAAVDLSDAESVRRTMRYGLSVYGHCDVLCNNAAESLVLPFADTTLAQWRRVMDVNVTAPYLMCQAVLNGMYHRGGSIVNVSSMWGTLGASCESAYAASKAALEALTLSLAQEYEGAVRINALAPGFVDTPMNAHLSAQDKRDFFAEHPTMRELTALEVAQSIWRLALAPTSGEVVRLGW